MAYVMNPNSYRLGFSLSWYDSWYSNKKLYPILLQNIISVRNFLIYYLTHKRLEQLDIYLSNLNLMIKSGRLFITFFFYETSFDLKKEKKNLNRIISRANLSVNIPFNSGIKLQNLMKFYRNILKFEDAFTFTINKDKLYLKNNWLRKIWKNWNLSLKIKLANFNSSDFLSSHFNWYFLRELKDMHTSMFILKNTEQKQIDNNLKNEQQLKKNTRLFYKQFLQGWKGPKTSFIDRFWKEEQILNDIYLSKYLNHTFDGKDRPMIQKFSISYNSIALKNILRSIHVESVKNMPFDKIEIKYLNRALKYLYKYKNFYYKYNRSFLFFSNKRFLNFYNLWLKKYLRFYNYKGINDFMLRGQAAFNNFLWLKRSRFKSYKKFISAKNRLIAGYKFGQGLYLDSWYTSTILAKTWKAVYNKKNQFVKLVRLNYEGQRFFTFFALLGLDPQSLLLEFYLRQHGKNYKNMLSTNWLYDIRSDRYYQADVNMTKITRFELTVLRKIYAIMNKNITFNWMYDKKDNSLNLLRFLRNLFFYATMPFFGSRFEQFAFLEKKRFKHTKNKLKSFLLWKKKNFLYKKLRKNIIYKLISLYKINTEFYNKLFIERKKQNINLSKHYIMFTNYKAYTYRSNLNFFRVRRFDNSYDYSIDNQKKFRKVLSRNSERLKFIIQRSKTLKKNYSFKTFLSRVPFYDTYGDNVYLYFMQEFRSSYILFKRYDYLGFAIDRTINLKELSFLFFFFILEDYFKLLISLNKNEEKKLIKFKTNFLKRRLNLIKKKLHKYNLKKEKIKGAPKERSLIALRRSGKKKKNSGINWFLIEKNVSIASGEEMRALIIKTLKYTDYFKRPHILKQMAAVPIFWNFSYKQKLRYNNLISLNLSKLLNNIKYKKNKYKLLKKKINKSKFIPILKKFFFQYVFSNKLKEKKKKFINLLGILKTYIYGSDFKFFGIFWEGRLFQLRMFQHMFKYKYMYVNLERAYNLARKKNRMHKYYVPLLDRNILKANVEQESWGSLNRIFVKRSNIFSKIFDLREFLLIKKLNNKLFFNENYYVYNNSNLEKNSFNFKFLLNKKKDYVKFIKKKFKKFFFLTVEERSKIKRFRNYFNSLNRKIIQNSIKNLVSIINYLYFEKIALLRIFYFFHKDFFLYFYNFNFIQELLKLNSFLKLNIFKKDFKIFNLYSFLKNKKNTIKKNFYKNKFFYKDYMQKLDLFIILLKTLYRSRFQKIKKEIKFQWDYYSKRKKYVSLKNNKLLKLSQKKKISNNFFDFFNKISLNFFFFKKKFKFINKKLKFFKKIYKYGLSLNFFFIKKYFLKNKFINYFFKFDNNIKIFLFNYNKALYFLNFIKFKLNKLDFLKKYLLKSLNKLNFLKKRNYMYIFYKLANLNFNIFDFFIKKSNILKKFKLLKIFIKFFFYLIIFINKFNKKKSYNLLKFVISKLNFLEKFIWNLLIYWKNYDYNFFNFYNNRKFKNIYYTNLKNKGKNSIYLKKWYRIFLKNKVNKKLKKILKFLKKKKSRKYSSLKIYYNILSHNNIIIKKKNILNILKYLSYNMLYYIKIYTFIYNNYFFYSYKNLYINFKNNYYKNLKLRLSKLKKKYMKYNKRNQLYFFSNFIKNYNKSFIYYEKKKKVLAKKEWKWKVLIQLLMFLINNQLFFYWKNILNLLRNFYKHLIHKFKNFYYFNISYLTILKNILLTVSFKQIISSKDISYYFMSFMDNFILKFFYKDFKDWKLFIDLNNYLINFNNFFNIFSNVKLNLDKNFILHLIEDKLQSNIKNIYLKKLEYLNYTLTVFKLNLWTPNIYRKKWERIVMNEKFMYKFLNNLNNKQQIYFKNIIFNLFTFSKFLHKESFILSKFEQRLFKFFEISKDNFFGNTFFHGKEQKVYLKLLEKYRRFLYKLPKHRFLNLRKKKYKNYTLLNLGSLRKMYKLVIIHKTLINKWNLFELYFNYANYLYKLNYNLYFFNKFYTYYKAFNYIKYDYMKYKYFYFFMCSLYNSNKLKFSFFLKKLKSNLMYYKIQYISAYKTYNILLDFLKENYLKIPFKNLDKSLLSLKEDNYVKLQLRLKYLKNSKKFFFKNFLKKLSLNFSNYIKMLKKYKKKKRQILIKNLLSFYLKMPLSLTYIKRNIRKNIKISKKFLLQKFWLGFFYSNFKKYSKMVEFKIYLNSMEIDGIYFWYNFLIFLRKYIYKKINWIFVFRKLKAQNFDSILTTYITKQLFYLRKFRKLYKKKFKLFLYKNNLIKKNVNFGFDIFQYFILDNWSKWKKKDLLNISTDFLHLQKVRFSYARLFFAFWYIRLSMPYNVKPIDIYDNSQYSDRHLFQLHMTLLYMLVKKPFLVMLSKYFSYIITEHWLGWNLVFNYVMVTNEDLSAQFIARHIANAFKMDFGWKDVIVPIKRDLSDLVTNYRFLAQRDNNYSIIDHNIYKKFNDLTYNYRLNNFNDNLFNINTKDIKYIFSNLIDIVFLQFSNYLKSIYFFWLNLIENSFFYLKNFFSFNICNNIFLFSLKIFIIKYLYLKFMLYFILNIYYKYLKIFINEFSFIQFFKNYLFFINRLFIFYLYSIKNKNFENIKYILISQYKYIYIFYWYWKNKINIYYFSHFKFIINNTFFFKKKSIILFFFKNLQLKKILPFLQNLKNKNFQLNNIQKYLKKNLLINDNLSYFSNIFSIYKRKNNPIKLNYINYKEKKFLYKTNNIINLDVYKLFFYKKFSKYLKNLNFYKRFKGNSLLQLCNKLKIFIVKFLIIFNKNNFLKNVFNKIFKYLFIIYFYLKNKKIFYKDKDSKYIKNKYNILKIYNILNKRFFFNSNNKKNKNFKIIKMLYNVNILFMKRNLHIKKKKRKNLKNIKNIKLTEKVEKHNYNDLRISVLTNSVINEFPLWTISDLYRFKCLSYAEFKNLKFYTNYYLSFLINFMQKIGRIDLTKKQLNIYLNERNINYNSNLLIYFKGNNLDINNLNIFEFFLHMKKVSYDLKNTFKKFKENKYVLNIKRNYQQKKQFKVDFSKFSPENKLYWDILFKVELYNKLLYNSIFYEDCIDLNERKNISDSRLVKIDFIKKFLMLPWADIKSFSYFFFLKFNEKHIEFSKEKFNIYIREIVNDIVLLDYIIECESKSRKAKASDYEIERKKEIELMHRHIKEEEEKKLIIQLKKRKKILLLKKKKKNRIFFENLKEESSMYKGIHKFLFLISLKKLNSIFLNYEIKKNLKIKKQKIFNYDQKFLTNIKNFFLQSYLFDLLQDFPILFKNNYFFNLFEWLINLFILKKFYFFFNLFLIKNLLYINNYNNLKLLQKKFFLKKFLLIKKNFKDKNFLNIYINKYNNYFFFLYNYYNFFFFKFIIYYNKNYLYIKNIYNKFQVLFSNKFFVNYDFFIKNFKFLKKNSSYKKINLNKIYFYNKLNKRFFSTLNKNYLNLRILNFIIIIIIIFDFYKNNYLLKNNENLYKQFKIIYLLLNKIVIYRKNRFFNSILFYNLKEKIFNIYILNIKQIYNNYLLNYFLKFYNIYVLFGYIYLFSLYLLKFIYFNLLNIQFLFNKDYILKINLAYISILFLKNNKYLLNIKFNRYKELNNLNIKNLLYLKKYELNVIKNNIYSKKNLNTYSNFLKKKTFIDYFYKHSTYLGFKIRLAGRFKRRPERVIVWIKKGLMPITSHNSLVEYGYFVDVGPFSTYSIRVWINRNKEFKHRYTFKL